MRMKKIKKTKVEKSLITKSVDETLDGFSHVQDVSSTRKEIEKIDTKSESFEEKVKNLEQQKSIQFNISDPKEIEQIKESLNNSKEQIKVEPILDYTSSILEKYLKTEKRNIYCGELRRIGKSTALLSVIKSVEKTSSDVIVLLVLDTNIYSEFRNFVDEITTPENFNQSISKIFESNPKSVVYLFSDEIPNVEQLLTGWKSIKYLGGFYSKTLDARQKLELTRTK